MTIRSTCVLAAALGILFPTAGRAADFYYSFSLNTSALVANPGQGPYKMDFQFTDGSGTNDGSMTFTGLVSDINAALAGMIFTPAADYNGARRSAQTSRGDV